MKKDECAVIINADDFGQTESCTRAIYEAFQKGLITDTTMVANGEAMELAFAMAPEMRGHIGAHLNLTEGPALTPAMRKCEICLKWAVYRLFQDPLELLPPPFPAG